jgi:hypothetical protein
MEISRADFFFSMHLVLKWIFVIILAIVEVIR